MTIEYNNKAVEKLFNDWSKMQKKIGDELARATKKRYMTVKSAKDINDLFTVRAGRPEFLSDKTISLKISANYRLIIIKSDETTVIIEGVCDYHGDKYDWIIS